MKGSTNSRPPKETETMCWKNLPRVIVICSAAAVLLAAPSRSRADCPLMDWLFGNGRTTYAPPYTPPTVYAPAAPSCGCAPVACGPCQPACQTCTPTTTYRISYRPVPTVTYMPVVAVDPCSGCAVTTYRPTQAWTYQASLVPSVTYRAGYAPVAAGVGCGGCAPCSGYSTSYGGCSSCAASCGGCSSCGVNYGGCSSCNAGVSSSYVASGGCSSCASGAAPLYGTPATSSPATIGAPSTVPAPPAGPPRTYAPGESGAPAPPIAPGAPVGGASPAGASYRGPTSGEDSRAIEPVRIEGAPPITNGPQLAPAPDAHPETGNRVTSRPVLRATYFQILPSSPASVPVQLISSRQQP
jgi:hypothetical protein